MILCKIDFLKLLFCILLKYLFFFILFHFFFLNAETKDITNFSKPKKKNTIQQLYQEAVFISNSIFQSSLEYDYKIGQIKKVLIGKFDYKKHPDFILTKPIHAHDNIYLEKTTYKAFIKMHNAAKKKNIDLVIISGTRSFDDQKKIWQKKIIAKKITNDIISQLKKILQFSAIPSTSRHHWGTDIDINSVNNSYFETKKGKKEYQWLKKNASKYGFFQVYEKKRNGYEIEKWHWSYYPLSVQYLKYYNQYVSYNDIKDFNFDYLSEDLKIIKNYVNEINPIGKGTVENQKKKIN